MEPLDQKRCMTVAFALVISTLFFFYEVLIKKGQIFNKGLLYLALSSIGLGLCWGQRKEWLHW